VEAHRGQLPRPGDEGPHPAGRGSGERPAGCRSDRASEEGRHGSRSGKLLADTGWLPEPLRTPDRAAGNEQTSESPTEETPEQSSEKLLEDEDEPAAQNEDTGEPMIAAE
jgi:hypothetical protein